MASADSSASSAAAASSGATGSSSTTSPATKTHTLFSSSSQTSSIKLDGENYLVWESVVRPLIKGNRLESHINGLGIIPPRMIAEGAGSVPNGKMLISCYCFGCEIPCLWR